MWLTADLSSGDTIPSKVQGNKIKGKQLFVFITILIFEIYQPSRLKNCNFPNLPNGKYATEFSKVSNVAEINKGVRAKQQRLNGFPEV